MQLCSSLPPRLTLHRSDPSHSHAIHIRQTVITFDTSGFAATYVSLLPLSPLLHSDYATFGFISLEFQRFIGWLPTTVVPKHSYTHTYIHAYIQAHNVLISYSMHVAIFAYLFQCEPCVATTYAALLHVDAQLFFVVGWHILSLQSPIKSLSDLKFCCTQFLN